MRQVPFLTDARGVRGAWVLWGVFAVWVAVLVAWRPDYRTVTRTYWEGSVNWWAGRDLYREGEHGFLYLPQSAILFTPFTWPPRRAGEVLWRWVCLGLYASGIWRLAKLAGTSGGQELFALVTILTMPSALGGARNGQANVPLAGLMIHAAVDLAGRRWWRATVSLSLALALKPMALVMLLLAAALYPPMTWRVVLGLAAVFLMPFLCADSAFAWSQYRSAIGKLSVAGRPLHGYNDVGTLLRVLGIRAPDWILMAVRAVAAPATLAVGWLGLSRWCDPRGAILVLGLADSYLMLFNPRTEADSYLILAPVVAVFAAQRLLGDGRPGEGWALAAIAVGLGSSNYGDAIHAWTDHWFKAVLGILFLAYLTYQVLARPEQAARSARPPVPEQA